MSSGVTETVIRFGFLAALLIGFGLAVMYAVKYYREACPDGLMACLGLNDIFGPGPNGGEDTPGTPGSTPGGEGSSNTITQSAMYNACSKVLLSKDTKICKNDTDVGVGWAWSKAAGAEACAAATKKWQIIATSSLDNHDARRSYMLTSPRADSFRITGSTEFVKDRNVKITIIPLDENNEQVAADLRIEADSTVSRDCSIIGSTAVNFTDLGFYKPPKKPEPEPSDCQGIMTTTSKCIPLDTTGPAYCDNNGIKHSVFTVSKDPVGTGAACPPAQSMSCRLTEADGCIPRPDDVPAPSPCQQSATLQNVTDGSVMGQFGTTAVAAAGGDASILSFDPKYYGTFYDAQLSDGSPVKCTKEYRATPDDKPGYYVRTKFLTDIYDIISGRGSCSFNENEPTYDQGACNTQLKPINCYGAWKNDGGDAAYEATCVKGPGVNDDRAKVIHTYKRYNQYYEIETEKQGAGLACRHADGDKRLGPLVDAGFLNESRCAKNGSCPIDCFSLMVANR